MPAASNSRATLGILATRVVLLPAQLVVQFAVISQLGSDAYGVYVFVLLGVFTVLPLSFLGFGGGLTYEISSGQHAPERTLVSSLLVGLFHGSVTALLVYLAWRYDLPVTRGLSDTLLLPVLSIFPCAGLSLVLLRTMMGAGWFTLMNVSTILGTLLTPLFLAILVLGLGLGLEGALYSLVCAYALHATIMLVLVWRRTKPRFTLNFPMLGDAYHYGFRDWIGGLAAFANLRLDQMLISLLGLNAGTLGVYGASARVTEILWLPPDAAGPVLFKRVAETKQVAERAEVTAQIHRALFAFTVLGCLGLAAIAPFLPQILGSDYAELPLLIWVLLPGTAAFLTVKVITKFFGGSDRPQYSSLGHLAGLLVTLPLGLFLIPTYGGLGAAITTTCSYIVIAGTDVVLFRRMTRAYPQRLFLIGPSDWHWAKNRLGSALSVWRDRIGKR
ncbi:MAG: polysaccharide biosynthesis C-terminal domain-containing protein [Bacteroidota bacterium]